LPFKKILRIANKYIDSVEVYHSNRSRTAPPKICGEQIIRKKAYGRSYCAIGRDAYHLNDPKRYPLFMLTNILGGPGMNSRLNLSLREKLGYVYSIDATYHGFTDSGMTGIYFGTEKKYLNRSIKTVLKELKKLREIRLGVNQLHVAKQQIKGQLAMAEENNTSLMLMLGRSILDLKRIDTLEEIFKKIDEISAAQIMEVANDIWSEKELNYLIYQPD
jgi:predicted Zn-dependent peptidase